MMIKAIGIIVLILVIILLNISDFVCFLKRGGTSYVHPNAGFGATIILLCVSSLVIIEDSAIAVFICVVYSIIYALIYFRLNELKEDRDERRYDEIFGGGYEEEDRDEE